MKGVVSLFFPIRLEGTLINYSDANDNKEKDETSTMSKVKAKRNRKKG